MKEERKPLIILLADDDADDRLLVKDAVAECRWEGDLRCVEDGVDLLDYLKHRGRHAQPGSAPRPALILLDLNMPKKDGREALREIKADPDLRRIPVVVLTTSKADTDVNGLYDIGASSFISKPVRFDSLVTILQELSRYWFGIVQLPAQPTGSLG